MRQERGKVSTRAIFSDLEPGCLLSARAVPSLGARADEGPQQTDLGQGFVHVPHVVFSAFRASGNLRSGFRTTHGKRDPLGSWEGRTRPRRGRSDRGGARRVGPATHAAGDRRTREHPFQRLKVQYFYKMDGSNLIVHYCTGNSV